MTASHSAQMLLKLEKCIPISHVTLETVPTYVNIERPTSSQLYASIDNHNFCYFESKMANIIKYGSVNQINCNAWFTRVLMHRLIRIIQSRIDLVSVMKMIQLWRRASSIVCSRLLSRDSVRFDSSPCLQENNFFHYCSFKNLPWPSEVPSISPGGVLFV